MVQSRSPGVGLLPQRRELATIGAGFAAAPGFISTADAAGGDASPGRSGRLLRSRACRCPSSPGISLLLLVVGETIQAVRSPPRAARRPSTCSGRTCVPVVSRAGPGQAEAGDSRRRRDGLFGRRRPARRGCGPGAWLRRAHGRRSAAGLVETISSACSCTTPEAQRRVPGRPARGGAATGATMRPATPIASSTAVPGSSTANSSPPQAAGDVGRAVTSRIAAAQLSRAVRRRRGPARR